MSSYMAPVDDFDSFINFDGPDANYAPEESTTTFSGPSHDYSTFRQQTGFPSGSMSNVNAYNDVNMDGNDFLSQPDFNSYLGPSDTFNSAMAFDTPSQSSAVFSNNNMDDLIDPMAVYNPQPAPTRMWPGMHSQQAQQAEQAKQAAIAKQQQHMQRLGAQHLMQQRLPSQTLPSFASSSSSASKGKQRAGSHVMTDAAAERKISDILESMRHKSAISPITEEDNDESEMARQRREEEEMDEDERLLASEEGKKLSSKERRQLRNKVSARAFRSRRKEYISQLEGDLATKASEANDLRVMNRKLLEENNQLKNLTRTVLSHPAFHTFLEDMSRNPTFVPPPAEMIAPQQMPSTSDVSDAHFDVKEEPDQSQNSSFRAQHEEIQVNSARFSQSSLDKSMLNLGISHWAGQSTSSFNYQPQVFAVFDLPQGPSREEILAAAPAKHISEDYQRTSAIARPTFSPASTVSALNTSSESNNVDDCLALIHSTFCSLEPTGRRLNLIV